MTRILTLLASVAATILLSVPASAAEVVPLPHFDGVGLRGGGHVTLKYGPEQHVTLLKGSTQYTRFTVEHGGGLTIDACNDRCPSHYDLEIEIVSPEIGSVAIEGGGRINAEGSFPARSRLDVAISGGGEIDARAVPASAVDASVNGGGAMKVAASGQLNAAVNGGGEIVYWGNPQVSQAVSGGGAIRRADR
jgi:putative autotransporter adhesin-like protein